MTMLNCLAIPIRNVHQFFIQTILDPNRNFISKVISGYSGGYRFKNIYLAPVAIATYQLGRLLCALAYFHFFMTSFSFITSITYTSIYENVSTMR